LLVAQELVESEAGDVGVMLVEGGSAPFPVIMGGEATEAVNGTAERGGRGAEAARRRKLEPGGKELISSGRFIGLERPGVRGSRRRSE
jgi:hypothetical protein